MKKCGQFKSYHKHHRWRFLIKSKCRMTGTCPDWYIPLEILKSSCIEYIYIYIYELCLNGLLLSDILPYPLFHRHVRLPVIRVCFTVCLMSHSFRYPQLTASGYLNLASVIAGPNTCGLTIVATMQHETLSSHIHVKWLAPNVYIYIYIYIYTSLCLQMS